MLKCLFKPVGGQSCVSWLLQIALLGVVWAVYEKMIPLGATTLLGAAALVIAIYASFALTKRFETKGD
ncbi:solute carrier family 44, member 2 [Coriobacterium glomerans PW2]|uniref:Solute carrier family 44, member 2 n=1 Tax=Coriobacterium glomerans (strain ATCC 49209 / DSM 20642 / JCM 10262 / PW2) TaxID=700015 RepID=F2N7D7_CORGP|nr:hypothetical protein [Coriobacterium glomerans]AEB06612.1 solute carrier family 44, member 2 [Coriobacterium glomerans PW2]